MSLPCLQSVPWKLFYDHDVSLNLWREDLNHPLISGNKFYKLKPNLYQALQQECTQVLSFGGPWSNHLHALAWAAREHGLKSIGVVRGEIGPELTPTLQDCQDWGMTLVPCSRTDYRRKEQPEFLSELSQEFPGAFIIPEGGSNPLAIHELKNLWNNIRQKAGDFDWVFVATGSGGTLAGLTEAKDYSCKLIGVQAVAEGDATLNRIEAWLKSTNLGVEIWQDGHLGGFAKVTPELADLIHQMESRFAISLDPIYTGKTLLRIYQALKQRVFKPGDRVLMLHTGGLQGLRGMRDRLQTMRDSAQTQDWQFD